MARSWYSSVPSLPGRFVGCLATLHCPANCHGWKAHDGEQQCVDKVKDLTRSCSSMGARQTVQGSSIWRRRVGGVRNSKGKAQSGCFRAGGLRREAGQGSLQQRVRAARAGGHGGLTFCVFLFQFDRKRKNYDLVPGAPKNIRQYISLLVIWASS